METSNKKSLPRSSNPHSSNLNKPAFPLTSSLEALCSIKPPPPPLPKTTQTARSASSACLHSPPTRAACSRSITKPSSVVQRDTPEALQQIVAGPASGFWLAYLDEQAVGCVVLKNLASIPFAAECKRLYVQPSARGHRIADKLLDAQEAFARTQGLHWIYLDSYDDLKVAIDLYRKRGYVPCDRYNDNPQATVFLRKNIA